MVDVLKEQYIIISCVRISTGLTIAYKLLDKINVLSYQRACLCIEMGSNAYWTRKKRGGRLVGKESLGRQLELKPNYSETMGKFKKECFKNSTRDKKK